MMQREFEDRLEQIAEGERWLATFPTPSPSPDAVRNTRRAVRAALERDRFATDRPAWKPWHGVLAAAASIALAVSAAWYSAGPGRSTHGFADAASNGSRTEEALLAAAQFVGDLPELDIGSIEAAWEMDGAALYEVYREAAVENGDSRPQGGSM